ncbi:MAG: DUF799 domain-containing protein [Pseudomonadales bacterium]|nr:DUF799 domain-containing protein [Pseudomonadales bacterium]
MAVFAVLVLMTACVTPPPAFDYFAFNAARPRSILVLPPRNQSPEISAAYGVLSQVTLPLAESGYYVLPVALVDETFRQNGMTVADDIRDVPVAKLYEIFGADAALYIDIIEYGAKYLLFDSAAVVTLSATLVDLRSGQTLWTGRTSATNAQNNNNGGGGIGALLVAAMVKQILNSVSDASYTVAGMASTQLLAAGQPRGLLYGPRHPPLP